MEAAERGASRTSEPSRSADRVPARPGSWSDRLPRLGVGVAYRPELRSGLLDGPVDVDWLEVITEHYLTAPPEEYERLAALRNDRPLVPHGLELSVGSPEGPDDRYLEAVARLVSDLSAPWFSDHLCFTRSGDVALGTLMPLPRTRRTARSVAGNARRAVAAVGVPLLLENITYHLDLGGELTEAEFLREVLEQADCGLLLDVTNLHVNSVNHGYDPVEFLEAIPLERVGQIHLAGGEWRDGVLRDSHSAPVHDEVWTLLEHVLGRTNPPGILLERDGAFGSAAAELATDLRHARLLVSAAGGAGR